MKEKLINIWLWIIAKHYCPYCNNLVEGRTKGAMCHYCFSEHIDITRDIEQHESDLYFSRGF